MKRKIRWGVIGSGGIASRRTIPEGILPARNAELVAVWGRNVRTNAAVAEQFKVHAATSLKELLSLDLDAVYIASPNHAHLDQATQCARAGKHVFCEKPLGMTIAEAKRMVRICHEAKVQLGTAFMMRYHGGHQAALKLIRAGKLGQPVFARAQLSCWYPPQPGAWRQIPKLAGGGALMDLAGHCLDLLEMFFGSVVAVSCVSGTTIHRYGTEDSGAVLARFQNGATATVDTFFCIRDVSSKNRLELYGSNGSILAEGTIGQGDGGEIVTWLENAEGYSAKQNRKAVAGVPLKFKPVNTYRAEIEAFSQALLDGKSTNDSAEAGLRSQILLAACYESARRRKEIKIRV